MNLHSIPDWDDAYANAPHIPGGAKFPAKWESAAGAFRAQMQSTGRAELDITYGEGSRQKLDLFLPENGPRGLVVVVHGGYWMRFDKSSFSHLAHGAVSRGLAVAMPSYRLCPEARIAEITRDIGRAIETAAARVVGPIRLTGHSAGGHLVSRMISADTPLLPATLGRIALTVSISGLHDLRPLMRTEMNDTLRLDAEEARKESPALLEPHAGARLVAWVGAEERPEFIRQSALIANIWTGAGATCGFMCEPDRHHFDVIEGLSDPRSPLLETLCAG